MERERTAKYLCSVSVCPRVSPLYRGGCACLRVPGLGGRADRTRSAEQGAFCREYMKRERGEIQREGRQIGLFQNAHLHAPDGRMRVPAPSRCRPGLSSAAWASARPACPRPGEGPLLRPGEILDSPCPVVGTIQIALWSSVWTGITRGGAPDAHSAPGRVPLVPGWKSTLPSQFWGREQRAGY